MAMLAEPRRKTKWTLNPRGKLWSEDNNKLGQKLLEKMGWKEGQGLGANEQGMTSHIQVQMKSDNSGVGFNGKDAEWCKHQNEFDSVLANLNETMGGVGSHMPTESLEERSKASKARLHYSKFTRGKDVAKYTSKDLGCILGVPNDPKKRNADEEEGNTDENIGTEEESYGVKTIVGGSINDYLMRSNRKTSNPDNEFVSDGMQVNVGGDRANSVGQHDELMADAIPGCSTSAEHNLMANYDICRNKNGNASSSKKFAAVRSCEVIEQSAADSTSDYVGSGRQEQNEYQGSNKRARFMESEEEFWMEASTSKMNDAEVPDSTTERKVSQEYLEDEDRLSQAGTVDEMLEIMVLGRSSASPQLNLSLNRRCSYLVGGGETSGINYHFTSNPTRTTYNSDGTALEGVFGLDNGKKKKKKSKKGECGPKSDRGKDLEKVSDSEVDGDTMKDNEVMSESKGMEADESSSENAAGLKLPKKMNKKKKLRNKSKKNKSTPEKDNGAAADLAVENFDGANLAGISGYGATE